MSRILVFGASGGVGAELSRRLSQAGHSLALVSRERSRLAELEAASSATLIEADGSEASGVEAAFDQAISSLGGLDGVVNCIGSILLKPAHLIKDPEWAAVIRTNLDSAFFVVREAARKMESGGSVVLFSTAAASIGLPNHEAIAAAKGGIEAMVRSAASGYAARGLRFNAVAPGLTRTPLTARITGNESALKNSEAMHALGRIGEPADIAAAAEFLLNPENNWVTGQTWCVDGGLSCLRSR